MSEKFSIAWWNTSLSPAAARDRASPSELAFAFTLIDEVLTTYEIDIFCLGEISPSNFIALSQLYSDKGYIVYDGTYNEGLIKHDLCILINTAKFTYYDSKSITEQSILGKIRAGQEIHLIDNVSGDDLFIYLSHWPSRSYDANDEMPKRYELGKALREAVEKCIEEKKGKFFIMIGDFNDDPFSKSLTHAFGATRDRDLVRNNNKLFYNPFWNFMGATVNFPMQDHEDSIYGTYYYKKGLLTQWHTFDQIIFSSSFICNERWHLLENEVTIVINQIIRELIMDTKSPFDHLPILAVIKRG